MTDENQSESSVEEDFDEGPVYTLTLNGKEYRLTEEFRQAFVKRASNEYRDNDEFSCWWKINEDGDPILVIETMGTTVPWDRLDQLEMEMTDVKGKDGGPDDDMKDIDEGGGVKTVPPSEVDEDHDHEEEHGGNRTYFGLTPRDFEEVPSPDGEEAGKLPPAPQEMPDHPVMPVWIPEDPEREEVWNTGEAMVPVFSWVEWNLQAKADEPMMAHVPQNEDGTGEDVMLNNSHNAFEHLAKQYDCEVIRTMEPKQEPSGDSDKPDGWYDNKDLPENSNAVGNRWNL